MKTTEIRADRVVLLGGGDGRARPARERSGTEPVEAGAPDSGPVEAPNDDDIPF